MATRTVKLDKRIYKAGAVKAAAKAYKDIVDIKVDKDDSGSVVILENWPEDYEDTIELEFCNYILWKMRN